MRYINLLTYLLGLLCDENHIIVGLVVEILPQLDRWTVKNIEHV